MKKIIAIILLSFILLSCEALLPPSSSNIDFNIDNPFSEIEITFDGKYYDIVSKSITIIKEVHINFNGEIIIVDRTLEFGDSVTVAAVRKWYRYSLLTVTQIVQ